MDLKMMAVVKDSDEYEYRVFVKSAEHRVGHPYDCVSVVVVVVFGDIRDSTQKMHLYSEKEDVMLREPEKPWDKTPVEVIEQIGKTLFYPDWETSFRTEVTTENYTEEREKNDE